MRQKLNALIILGLSVLLGAPSAFAAGATAAAGAGTIGLAAGLAIGLAAIGGAFGQGKAASAAFDSIGRNPSAAGKLQTPMILALVFMETLVIFSFAIAILLIGKI